MRNFDEVQKLFKSGITDNGVIASYSWDGETAEEAYISFIDKIAENNINKLLIKLDIKLNDSEWLSRLEGVLAAANKNKIKVILQDDEQKTFEKILKALPASALKRMSCHVQHTYVDREVYIIPDNAVSVTAMEVRSGVIDGSTAVDLRPLLSGSFLRYNTPSNKYQIFTVYYDEISICDYTCAFAGEYILNMWDWLYSALPLFLRQSICGICTSEHPMHTDIYSDSVCKEIKKSRGYDITKLLSAIFYDIGPFTQQIRMDYRYAYDKFYNENYVSRLCGWTADKKLERYVLGHGLPYSQDKARYIYEIKNHDDFYRETVEAVQDGYSDILLTGLDRDSRNIFTSPLAGIAGDIVKCLNRIMLFSAVGEKAADIAVLYPESTIQGGESAEQAIKVLDKACGILREENCLFDVISEKSFMSLETDKGRLKSEEHEYRIVVLPRLYSMRNAQLEKLISFLKNGGIVIMLEEEPYASESGGRENKQLQQYKKELLGGKYAFMNGKGFSFCLDFNELKELLNELKLNKVSGNGKLDYICRRTADADYYMLFNAAVKGEYKFKSIGDTVMLLPETGGEKRIYPQRQKSGLTSVEMPYYTGRVCILAFNRNKKALPVLTKGLSSVINADEIGKQVQASYVSKGEKRVYLQTPQITYVMKAYAEENAPEEKELDGLWLTRINNIDNSGRTYLPLYRFKCGGQSVCAGEGVKLLLLGPFPEETDTVEIEREISTIKCPDMEDIYEIDGREYKWSEYSYSDTIDSIDGYGRFVCKIANESAVRLPQGKCYLWTAVKSEQEDEIELLSGYRPRRLYINGTFYDSNRKIRIKAGINNILMRFDSGCETYLHFRSLMRMEADSPNTMLEYRYDPYPYKEKEICTLDAELPPNISGIVIKAFSEPSVFVDSSKINLAGVSGHDTLEKAYRYVISPSSDGKRKKLIIELAETDGCYGGGVLAGPVELYFRDSVAELEAIYGLECLEELNGSIVYEKSFFIDEVNSRICVSCSGASRIISLSVNNSKSLLMLAQPYKADITELVRAGNNKIVITSYSPWEIKSVTGLSSPAKLSFENIISIGKCQ